MSETTRIQKDGHLPELLAPAGSPLAFRAAVAAGADAVYLGGKQFGARKFATNFTDEEIEEAVDYAHRRDVAVYVTLNTLIHDRELAGVGEYLLLLYSVGVDAVLVQDAGITRLARDIVPGLILHASTQMTIHNTGGIRWAAEQGYSRVVLARELSLADITSIAREAEKHGIGLEVFAHGALCYSFSGQCLLSSVIGGRSGNRGMCAQPCRKPYSLVTGPQDRYGRPAGLQTIPGTGHFLLSPRDLCTFTNLPDLVGSPIVSLKIEGRMRSPEYVSIVVSTYRKALDSIAAGNVVATQQELQDLLLAFNRGFTSGYLFGERHEAFMGRTAADNQGIFIGVVESYDSRSKSVTITSSGTSIPRPGDGLHFILSGDSNPESGFSLNKTPRRTERGFVTSVPWPVKTGSLVYLTYSADLAHRAREIINHPQPGLRHPVPVDLAVRVEGDGSLIFDGLIHTKKGKKIPVLYHSESCMVPAQTRPVSGNKLELQLMKTGNSPFLIRDLALDYGGNMFAPIATLNHARREFLARAEEKLLAASRPSPEDIEQAHRRWDELKPDLVFQTPGRTRSSSLPLCLSVYADSPESVRQAVEGGCDVICYEPVFVHHAHGCFTHAHPLTLETQILDAFGICREAGVRFVCKLPKITKDEYLDSFRPVIPSLMRMGIHEYMVENCGAIYVLLNADPDFALSGSSGLNIFNHLAVQSLSPRFGQLTLSPELSCNEIRILIQACLFQGLSARFSLIVQGNIEAMISEDCVLQPWLQCSGKNHPESGFTGVMDATGHVFPVRIDGECRSHIYNAAELCLIDHLPAVMETGINEVIIDARGRTGAYAGDMTRIYRQAITLAKNGIRHDDQRIKDLKESVKCRSLGGITAGHFVRGLKES